MNNLAVALLNQGKLQEAIGVLESALKGSPSSVVVAEPFLFNLCVWFFLVPLTCHIDLFGLSYAVRIALEHWLREQAPVTRRSRQVERRRVEDHLLEITYQLNDPLYTASFSAGHHIPTIEVLLDSYFHFIVVQLDI